VIHDVKGSLLMNSASRIETAELSDTELDNVAGGLDVQAGVGVNVVAGVEIDRSGIHVQAGAGAYAGVNVGQLPQTGVGLGL
jgi:hypothetical protein